MATLTVRIDDWTREELDRLAQAHGTTTSDLLRSKIDELLGTDTEDDDRHADGPRSMTMIERRTFIMLHQIQAKLTEHEYDKAFHERRVTVLENGFTAEYGEEFVALGPELSQAECRLVWDLLDMFTTLESSFSKLAGADKAVLGDRAERRLSFIGFDANDQREARLLGYARYLINDAGKWESLAHHMGNARDRGNSRRQTLPMYLRMLAVYKRIWQEKTVVRGMFDLHFAVDELQQVLNAQNLREAS